MNETQREVGRLNETALLDYVNSYRPFVERGDKSKLVYVVDFCLSSGLPLPEWIEADVRAAMRLYYEKGGSGKQGEKGNRKLSEQNRKDMARYQAVERERERPGATKESAIESAISVLEGSFAEGSFGQIEASYGKIARQHRDKPRKPGPKPRRT